MANLGQTFDPNSAEKRSGYDVITGWVPAQVIESDVMETKNGGVGLKLTFEVIEGPHERRKVWGFINVQNPSPEAQRIGQSELRELCEAVGLGPITDSEVLHFKPLMLKCGPDKQDNSKTAVKGYKPYERGGAVQAARPVSQPRPAQASQTAQHREPATASAGWARPWSR